MGGSAFWIGWLLVSQPEWQRLSVASVVLGVLGGGITGAIYRIDLQRKVRGQGGARWSVLSVVIMLSFIGLGALLEFFVLYPAFHRPFLPIVWGQESIWVALFWMFSEGGLMFKASSDLLPVVEAEQGRQGSSQRS